MTPSTSRRLRTASRPSGSRPDFVPLEALRVECLRVVAALEARTSRADAEAAVEERDLELEAIAIAEARTAIEKGGEALAEHSKGKRKAAGANVSERRKSKTTTTTGAPGKGDEAGLEDDAPYETARDGAGPTGGWPVARSSARYAIQASVRPLGLARHPLVVRTLTNDRAFEVRLSAPEVEGCANASPPRTA